MCGASFGCGKSGSTPMQRGCRTSCSPSCAPKWMRWGLTTCSRPRRAGAARRCPMRRGRGSPRRPVSTAPARSTPPTGCSIPIRRRSCTRRRTRSERRSSNPCWSARRAASAASATRIWTDCRPTRCASAPCGAATAGCWTARSSLSRTAPTLISGSSTRTPSTSAASGAAFRRSWLNRTAPAFSAGGSGRRSAPGATRSNSTCRRSSCPMRICWASRATRRLSPTSSSCGGAFSRRRS